MGKPTGFMEYQREEAPAFSVYERIKNFDEFHEPLSREEQQKQGARCMECGVPFCQSGMMLGGMISGCPLNNLIPEWNDLVFRGAWEQAYHRLKITNNFPEFTSRVCPALCEKACTCGANGDAVTVRNNEFAIVETAYANGWAQLQGEQMNFTGMIYGDEMCHAINKVSHDAGMIVTGHYPILDLEQELSAYIACGISSCHEIT